MLYRLFEAQRTWLRPFAELANASAELYGHPLSPFSYSPLAQHLSAGLDLAHRLTRDYEKPDFDIHTVRIADHDVAVREVVAANKPFCRLLHFRRYGADRALLDALHAQPKVLVVAPLSGHHSTLLRDTVQTLLTDHDVYLTDWTDARLVPLSAGAFHLDDYIAYVQDFIRLLGADVHVLAVCQPAAPVLAAIALLASRREQTPRSMTLMGGPIDGRKSPTAVNKLATGRSLRWFETHLIHRVPPPFAGEGRRVYPGFLQHASFVAMNPERHASSHYDYFLHLVRGDGESAEAHRRFYDEYNAVLDMPAEYYLDTVKTVFQDFALVHGTWHVAGERVQPGHIVHTALFTVEGEFDDIAGAGQTHAAHELCTGLGAEHRHRYDVPGAGHYGIFSGRRWREQVYPELRSFIARFR